MIYEIDTTFTIGISRSQSESQWLDVWTIIYLIHSVKVNGRFLKGKSLAIACPKLDSKIDLYIDKLVMMIDSAKINTLTVLTMEVPCCKGLLAVALKAREGAIRNIPIKSIVITVRGEVKSEEWI